jgi:hypothetical protein
MMAMTAQTQQEGEHILSKLSEMDNLFWIIVFQQ